VKKRLLSIAVVLMGLAILSMGTLAYFTDEATAHNIITSGDVNIELKEWADAEKTKPFEKVDGVMPGETVTKIVEVANIGTGDAWVRMKVTKEIQGPLNSAKEADELLTLVNIGDQWELQDGYYYYKEPLKAKATSQPLFEAVKLETSMNDRFQSSTVKIDVTAEAIQSDNMGAQSAVDAFKSNWN